MARPRKFSTDEILDAARDEAQLHWRDTTIAHVATRVGAPVGSIYHRFASRDDLFGALWERSIRRFHVGLLAAAALPDVDDAVAASVCHIPRFCRDHPADALAMTLYRLPDLVPLVPEPRRPALETINDEVDAALRDLTRRRYGRLTQRRFRLAMLGMRLTPFGVVRPWVGQAVPAELDDVCLAAARGVLALGDRG